MFAADPTGSTVTSPIEEPALKPESTPTTCRRLTSRQGRFGGLPAGGAVTAAYAIAPRGPRRAPRHAAACAGPPALLLPPAHGRASQPAGGTV
ncbi:hypothetical protein AB0L04_11765 [Streptomyces glaucescens]|uniref:hypothetical protein n=1 Tax=Streptomyces glaucescens TaxID=1907 RepID=UPI0034508876